MREVIVSVGKEGGIMRGFDDEICSMPANTPAIHCMSYGANREGVVDYDDFIDTNPLLGLELLYVPQTSVILHKIANTEQNQEKARQLQLYSQLLKYEGVMAVA